MKEREQACCRLWDDILKVNKLNIVRERERESCRLWDDVLKVNNILREREREPLISIGNFPPYTQNLMR